MSRRARPHRGSVAAAGTPVDRAARRFACAIALAALLVYANSLANPFLFDDLSAVTRNTQIRSLSPSVALSPPDETPVARRPLVNLTFAVNYAVGGLDVRGYHAGNLLVHVLAALAFFGLVRRALRLDSLAPTFGRHATALAGAAALVWVLHPLHTEIIDYVSQRTAALMGMCYLLTLYCSVRALRGPRRRWSVLAVLACAAGMASKETMVTAPLLVVLFDRVFVFTTLRGAIQARRGLYAGLASTWLILAGLMAVGDRSTVGFGAGVGAWSYLLNQSAIIVDYLWLAVWPVALVVDYGVPVPIGLGQVWWQALSIVALLVATLAGLWFRPRAAFAGAVFFLTLAPTSSIVPIATEVGAERRMYLPLAALVALAVCLAYRSGSAVLRWERPRWPWPSWPVERAAPQVSMAALVILCALFGGRAALRNHEYRSALTLARVTVERRPHGRSYYALANALLENGRSQEAISTFRLASRDFAPGHFALGSLLLSNGELESGIAELRAFTRRMPDHAAVGPAQQMIANALSDRGEYPAAIDLLQQVVGRAPDNLRAQVSLGRALLRVGRHAEAVPHLTLAADAAPRERSLQTMLGAALAESGHLEKAVARFKAALALDPQDPASTRNLRQAEANLAYARRLRTSPAR